MGFISGLVALLRAAPVLERFVLLLGDRVREAKAKARYEAKLAHIDAAMRLHGLPDADGTEQRPDPDDASAVPPGGSGRT
jgi:hypothetical protein